MSTLTKKQRKKPVKKLTEQQRLDWLKDRQRMSESLARLARVNRAYQAQRFTGIVTREQSFGELPEAGGTSPEEFWSRRDTGSV